MSEQTSYRCDICNIEKQQSNHWLKGYLIDKDGTNAPAGLMIIPWIVTKFTQPFSRDELGKPDAHLCGEAHAIEWASKNLAKR